MLRLREICIMLDSALDLSNLLMFLPSYRNLFSNLPCCTNSAGKMIEELKVIERNLFVDGVPELQVPKMDMLDMADVDVILVSNFYCMLALPYVTQTLGFSGVILCTEPTQQIGRLFMEELVEYVDKVAKPHRASSWKNVSHIINMFPEHRRQLLESARSWRQCYNLSSVHRSLDKVEIVAFNESKSVFSGLKVTAVSSGYCIGSCNWIIQTTHEKIVYLSASSLLTTHPKPMDQLPLKSSDVLIMSCLTQTPTANPDSMMNDFCANAAMTLKSGGNVLVPCSPSGVIYDLIEFFSSHLETCGLSYVPMYFISPVANSSLAYSNIYAEWLSLVKQSKVYLPEAPFPHSELVRNNRLCHYPCVSDGFYNEMRIPCVIFAGHSSLRFGDAVHFMSLWSKSPSNSIIFTEPDLPFNEILAPFHPVSMKVFHCPIDTSLSFPQANKLIRELKPRHLVVSDVYTTPPIAYPQRSDLTIDGELSPIACRKHDVIKLPLKRKYHEIEMQPEFASSLIPQEVKPGIGVVMVTGSLTNRDSKYIMQASSSSVPEKEAGRKFGAMSKTYPYGTLDVQEFVKCLKQLGIQTKVEEGKSGQVIIDLPHDDTLITVDNNSTHVICQGNETIRLKIRDALLQCLSKLQ